MDDFELQRADGGEERGTGRGVAGAEGLDDAFLQQLLEAGAVFLGVAGVRVGDVGENLGREARDLVVGDRCLSSVSVSPMPNSHVADEADDVAGPGLVDGLAFLAEELVGGGEADGFAGALVGDDHVALELAGAHAEEGDAVAVLRVHVGLDLEDEAGEFVVGDGISRFGVSARGRTGGGDRAAVR